MACFCIAGSVFWLLALLLPNSVDRYGRTESTTAVWPVFVGLSLIFLLMGIAILLNHGEIFATPDSFLYRHGPLFPKKTRFEPAGLKQFFVSKAISQTTTNILGRGLAVIDAQDHLRMIASTFPSYHAMNQVASELQNFYGLEDLPIHGETAPAGSRHK